MPHEPTVFVVDDDIAVRDMLKWLLISVGLKVEAYDSAKAFLDGYTDNRPGCLLLDVRMPGMSGLQLQSHLQAQGIDIPTIFISGHGDVQMAVHAMKEGAIDFIEKPFNNQTVIDTVQSAINRVTASLSEETERAQKEAVLRKLTERERQVLDGVVSGKTNKQIANEYELSEKTIEMHRSKLMRKLGVSTMAHLVRLIASLEQNA